MKYIALSPDGFDTEYGKIYSSKKEAVKAIEDFANKYETQGYYSTVIDNQRVRIQVSEIKNYCEIVKK